MIDMHVCDGAMCVELNAEDFGINIADLEKVLRIHLVIGKNSAVSGINSADNWNNL